MNCVVLGSEQLNDTITSLMFPYSYFFPEFEMQKFLSPKMQSAGRASLHVEAPALESTPGESLGPRRPRESWPLGLGHRPGRAKFLS